MKTKRALLLLVLCTTLYLSSFTQTTIGRQKVDQYASTAWGTPTNGLTWLPADYQTTTTKYPLIIFLHGSGEAGDGVAGLSKLISTALPQKIAQGWDPQAVSPTDGQNYKFIVVSPQAPLASQWSYAWGHVQWILADVIKKYRIDTTRIYVTGLSAGGAGTWSCVTNGIAAAQKFAAIVPVSAAGTNSPAEGAQLPLVGGTYGAKVWNVCGATDSWISFAHNATATINTANPVPAVPATLTVLPGLGHEAAAWNKAYEHTWRTNSLNLNIYEWMLKYKRGATASNLTPVSNAGKDVALRLPTNSILLSGSASDADGVISSYQWRKISGPDQYTIASSTLPQTAVNNIVQGTYQFELKVTDNAGATGLDTIVLSVNSSCGGVRRIVLPEASGGRYITGNPSSGFYFNYNPGDTLVLKAQYNTWSYFSMEEIYGTPNCPVVIINQGGQVKMTHGIEMKSCRYIKLTGSGDAANFYGFRIYNPGQDNAGVAIGIQGKSKNVEIDRIDVYRKTYGVWAKQDPLCDTTFNYPHFTMDSVEIHDCRFKNIGQDCIYAGNTDPIGLRDTYCNGVLKRFIPMRISNFNIHHLIIDSCNRTGIQLSGAETGYNQIHHNRISRCGFELNQQQGTGISIGGMSNAVVYDNYIRQTFLYGILSVGSGFSRIENNNIDSSGMLQNTVNTYSQPCNIYVDARQTIPLDSTLIWIKNNVLGANAVADGKHIILYKTVNSYAVGNVICSNTTLTGAQAGVYVSPNINWTTNCATPMPANLLPRVWAGADQTITLPVSVVQLVGSGSDQNGYITSFAWSKVSGPLSVSIAVPAQPQTLLTVLFPGEYQFELKVTDNQSAVRRDTAKLTVVTGVPNIPPVANAGPDKQITLPNNTIQLTGSGTDADGTITAYQWKKISGPVPYSIVTPASSATIIANLVQGTYKFELQVTDNRGAIARDTVVLIVNKRVNLPPVANAGTDRIVHLHVDSVQLTGIGTDSDGSIVSYKWKKISGPSTFACTNDFTAQTFVKNLVQGIYVLELIVVDDEGAEATDKVQVTVTDTSVLSVSVYPNPASSTVNIKIQASTYTDLTSLVVYDQAGRAVFRETFMQTQGTLVRQVDMSRFPRGAYLIEVATNRNNKVGCKLIKQ